MHRAIAVLALTLAVGCDETGGKGTTESADTGTEPPTTNTETGDTGTTVVDPDDDEDGFPASVDCDDTDPGINPDAEEACDGIDNNCDKGVDDVFAATIGGTSYGTLDDALAAAGGTDVVDVCPGTWTMAGLTRSDDLTLVGIAGRDATTISEVQGGTVLMIESTATVDITGVTITGSATEAIVVMDDATLRMTGSRVSDNQGTAIAANVSGQPTIELTGTDLEDNVSDGDGGGLSLLYGANATLTNSNVRGNSAARGGGIFATPAFGLGGVVTLDGSTVSENDAGVGGGIYAEQTEIFGLNAAAVSGNVASGDGGGLALYDAPVDGLLVSTNSATRGGGIAALNNPAYDAAPLHTDLTAVVLDSNTASDVGAGMWIANREAVTVDAYSAVTLNVATTSGGGAQLAGTQSSLASDGADWGTRKVNDNAPDDVTTSLASDIFDGPSTFTCSGLTGCL